MHIAYLHQYFNTHDMPGSTRSFELARRLVARGHTVDMITSWRGPTSERGWFESEEQGVRVHWLPVPYSNVMSYRERISAFLRFASASAARAATTRADLVYATSTPLTIALPGAWASARLDAPMVFELRDLWPDVPVSMGVISNPLLIAAARRLERFAYKRAAAVVVLTPTMRDFVSGKGVPLERISVVPNGADPSRFPELAPVGREERAPTLLYCGALGPAHGPEYLLDLAEAFRSASLGVRIVVAGEGKLRPDLEARAKGAGLGDEHIRFVGEVPQDDVPGLYAQADASVMTMADCELLYRHSVQNKFFDSLAAGRPIFANYRGWASELAERFQAGAVLPRRNPDAAASLIAKRLGDAEWLLHAGQSSRELLLKHFDFENLTSTLEATLEEALAKRHR